MSNCKRCDELLTILKDVKDLMDSDTYLDSFDDIYDRISTIIKNDE